MTWVWPALGSVAGLALLGFLVLLRLGGVFSHQALAVILFVGLAVGLVSRAWSWWKGELVLDFARSWRNHRELWPRVVGRAAFWLVLTVALGWIFPRTADFTGLIVGLLALGLLRVALELLPPNRPGLPFTGLLTLGTALLAWDLTWAVLPQPKAEVQLEPPFTGEWLVLQGGQSPLLSHHLSAYNQVFAADLMRLVDGKVLGEGEGQELWPSWGQPLRAPVAGTVVKAQGDLPDSEGANIEMELEKAAGNTVVIETAEGAFVVLAHLQEGSVLVAEGDVVKAGDPLALCGNSGNSTGSHLHLQVQTHLDIWDPDNRSLPFAFGGSRALRRNQRVVGR